MKILNRKISVKASMAIIVITILLISVIVIFAAGGNFTVPYTFTSGTTIKASEVNANFQAVGQALPAYKTMSFGPTTVSGEDNNVSGLFTVTPSESGFLTVYVTGTATTGSDINICLCKADASGNMLSCYLGVGIPSSGLSYANIYPQGYVTAGTPLHFYVKGSTMSGTTTQGTLSALFIPAPNQLP
jgi:hypothetical protein